MPLPRPGTKQVVRSPGEAKEKPEILTKRTQMNAKKFLPPSGALTAKGRRLKNEVRTNQASTRVMPERPQNGALKRKGSNSSDREAGQGSIPIAELLSTAQAGPTDQEFRNKARQLRATQASHSLTGANRGPRRAPYSQDKQRLRTKGQSSNGFYDSKQPMQSSKVRISSTKYLSQSGAASIF